MVKTIKVNANKTNLNKIIKWTTSRFNEFRKGEVIENILSYIHKGKDIDFKFGTGTYTEATGGYGWNYHFKIKDGKITLKKYTTDKILEKYELIKTKRFRYVPSKTKIKPYTSVKKYRKTISDRYRQEAKELKEKTKEKKYSSVDSFIIDKMNFSNIKKYPTEKKNLFEYSGIKKYNISSSELVHPFLYSEGYYDERHFNILAKNLDDLKQKLKKEYITKFLKN